MKTKNQHIDECQRCSCNKNRQCKGYRIMIDKGHEFNLYMCDFMVHKWKKPKIEVSDY